MITASLNTIIWLGTLQGFVLSVLLYFTRRPIPGARLLSCILLLMSLACLHLSLFETGLLNANGITATLAILIPMILVMPLGPLLWLYVLRLTGRSLPEGTGLRRHFASVIIDLIPSLTVIVYFAGVFLHLWQPDPGPWGSFLGKYNVYADIPRWLSMTLYLGASWKLVTRDEQGMTIAQQKYAAWLRPFLLAFFVFQFIWLMYLVPYIIPSSRGYMLDHFSWYPVYVPLAILIYALGLRAYLADYKQFNNAGKTTEKISVETINHTARQLQDAMEKDRLYLDPDLNLSGLSVKTGIPQKMISAVLNNHLGKSFSNFVNGYRVEAFKQKLQAGADDQLTIAGLAADCGFSSPATFQRIFKEFTGLSPSDFKKTLAQSRL